MELYIIAVVTTAIIVVALSASKKSKRRKRHDDKIVTAHFAGGKWQFTAIDRGDYSRDRHEDTMV